MNEPTPSPFLGTFDAFFEEFKTLCKKYNYDQIAVLVSEPFDNDDMSNWESASNCASEGMVGALENMAEQVADRLANHEED